MRRSYGRFDDRAFRDCFGHVLDDDCPHFLEGLSFFVEVVSFLDSLHNAIIFALDDQAPLRSFPVRRLGAPWLPAISRARIKERNYLFRRAKGSGSFRAIAEYRRFRNVLVADWRRAQSDQRGSGVRRTWLDCGVSWLALVWSGLRARLLSCAFVTVSCASSACSATDLATALDFPLPTRSIFLFSNVSSERVFQIIIPTTSLTCSRLRWRLSFFHPHGPS